MDIFIISLQLNRLYEVVNNVCHLIMIAFHGGVAVNVTTSQVHSSQFDPEVGFNVYVEFL